MAAGGNPGCITLIGMAGAGKSTVGRLLAADMGLPFEDTDDWVARAAGQPLAAVVAGMTTADFLALEERVVCGWRPCAVVLASGGSVVYGAAAMAHLCAAGPVVYLRAPLALVAARIAMAPARGLVRPNGRTLAEEFAVREELYQRYADITVDVAGLTAERVAAACLAALAERRTTL